MATARFVDKTKDAEKPRTRRVILKTKLFNYLLFFSIVQLLTIIYLINKLL